MDKLSRPDAEKFDYACMVSFTDGYDNHSMDPSLGVPEKGLENPYFKYVRDNVVNRNIKGSNLKSYVIAIRGNDVAEDNKLYKSVFQGISSEEPFLLDDFSQLEAQFEKMAQELIKRWQNLTCYVPSAHQGKVRWTLGNDFTATPVETPVEPVIEDKQPPAAKPYKSFFGLNAGLDFEVAPKFFGGPSVGLDFAIPKEKCAIGGLLSVDYCIAGPTRLDVGPLFLFGDYMNAKAFMLGAALDMRFPTTMLNHGKKLEGYLFDSDRFGAGVMLRLGLTLPSHLYFFLDAAFGANKSWYNPDAATLQANPTSVWKRYPYVNFSLNVGYRFGK